MRLYKYFNNVKNVLSAIGKCSFKFTPLTECNDLFEMMPAYRKLTIKEIKELIGDKSKFYFTAYNFLLNYELVKSKEEFEKRINDVALISQLTELLNENNGLLHHWHDEARNKIGICSLTKTSEELLMWSHYGNKHQGVVIGYDFDEENWGNNLVPVNYETDRLVLDPIETSALPKEELVLKYLDRKSIHWKYEQEVRLIANIKNMKAKIINDNEIYLQEFEHAIIKEVIMGFNIDNEYCEKLSKLLSIEKLKHVELKIIVPIRNKYKIRAESIFEKYKSRIHKEYRKRYFQDYYLSRSKKI